MTRLMPLAALCALLTACASDPAPNPQAQQVAAIPKCAPEVTTGSNISRRGTCRPLSPEEIEAARADAERMRDGTNRMVVPIGARGP